MTSPATIHPTARVNPSGVAAFGVLLFSLGPVIVASASTSGPTFSFWRLWFGTGLVAVVCLVHWRLGGAMPTRSGWTFAVLAGVAFGFHQLTMNTALQMTSVVDVTLMNTLAPIVVGALAIPLFAERPGTRFRLWSVMAFVGAGVVVIAGSSGPQGDPAGMVIAALNVVFYSLYFVASKRARVHIDTIPFLLAANGIAAIVLTGWVLVVQDPVGSISGHDLLLCFAVAAVPGLMGHFSVTWSVRWVPANLPPVLMLSIPFLAGVMAWLLLDQDVTAIQVVGGFITLAGVAGAVFAAGTTTPVEALSGAEET